MKFKIIPITRAELPRFICMSMMLFFGGYMYGMLQMSKNAIVLSKVDTEVISAIKIWLTVPVSMIFMLLYIKISDLIRRTRLFHLTNWFFLSYYVLFALFLYPHREAISIDTSHLVASFPALRYFFSIVSNWYYCLYYLFAELWVTMVLTVAFWQIINNLVSVTESKRIYPLLFLASQCGLLLATKVSKFFVESYLDWQVILNGLVSSMVIVGVILSLNVQGLARLVGMKRFNASSAKEAEAAQVKSTDQQSGCEGRLSFVQGLKYLATSKYLLLITALLLSYNIAFNLTEGIWKKAIEVFFAGETAGVFSFMSDTYKYMALFTIVSALLASYLLPILKWRSSALITPIVITVMGLGFFFLFVMCKNDPKLILFGHSALAIAAYTGSIHIIFTKATKHTLFDPVKEALFIPMDPTLKNNGKTMVEVVGMRLGRGVGALIQQVLLMTFVNLSLVDLVYVIFGLFFVVMLVWIYSTFALDRLLLKSSLTSKGS